MHRLIVSAAVAALLVAAGAAQAAHVTLDHPYRGETPVAAPLSTAFNSGGGPDVTADWELVTTIPTGNPHSDLDFFTRGSETFMSAGTLGTGPNGGGQTIIQLTQDGEVDPVFVGAHPSAACPTATSSVTGLQHDVEASPKGDAFQQQPNPYVARGDAQILVDATDAAGRCHDQGTLGLGQLGVPNGGLEIVDITNPAEPHELVLTSHIGNAHTVNVDPKRPHIAFDITQDGVTVGSDGVRGNEKEGGGNALDGFEIIDMSSCMNFAPGTTLDAKRAACDPKVYRYRYPEARMATSHHYPNALQSCHEVEIYPDDRLACASITSTILFDLSGAFDDNGTPTDFTDDKPRGTPLPCKRRASTTTFPEFQTGAAVIDCATDLNVFKWIQLGSPSLEGVEWIGTVPHMGFGATQDIVNTPYDSDVDVLAAHESELTQSGNFVMTSDERGGGVVPGGATCSPGVDNKRGNGGMHFFPVDNFTRATPLKTADAQNLWAKTSEGGKAIYRANIRTQPEGSFCTSHVFQQIPGQNRVFMGWYSQGTQVFDFVENADGTVDFKEIGYFTPENANTWTSHVFKAQRNPDGTFTYWGAAADGILPGTGRGAIDIYKVTLPAAPEPRGGPAPGTPTIPTVAPSGACARTAAFDAVAVRPYSRRRGLEFRFGGASARVDLLSYDHSRVLRFPRRGRTFRWNGKAKGIRNGYYKARFRGRAANGRVDSRQVALRRKRGRWYVLDPFQRRDACGFLRSFALSAPAFRKRLRVAFQVSEPANVTLDLLRGRKRVRRLASGEYRRIATQRLRIPARGLRRGVYRVRLRAKGERRAITAVLTTRRIR
jgi:hypothetical protein